MAFAKTFIGTRFGATFAAIYTIFLSVITVVWFFTRYVEPYQSKYNTEFHAMAYTAFGLYGAVLVSSLLLLGGICLSSRRLFYPWMIIMVMVLLFDTGSISLTTALHLDRERGLSTWETVGVGFYIVRMLTNVFSMASVHSYYRKKTWAKDPVTTNPRQFPLATLGGTLDELPPPYSLTDPGGLNPPPYSELAVESLCDSVVSSQRREAESNLQDGLDDPSVLGRQPEQDLFETNADQAYPGGTTVTSVSEVAREDSSTGDTENANNGRST